MRGGPMTRSIRRWAVAVWAILVLVGGAITLYLQPAAEAPAKQQRWERHPAPTEEPDPCPSAVPDGPADAGRNCAVWERG
ncbi:hypothetical protein AMK16_20205 [Streptomyces sp. CB00455]|nr:hypothetical protein AMK16_20205 [Streptomyces sp. CB00455]